VNPEMWSRAQVLFERAMGQPPHERLAWLAQAGADADVAALVQTLI
jgi:hypothetical protein